MATPTAMLVVATALFVVSSADYPYKEKYTTQYVDHFNYKNKATFPARYLVSGWSSLPTEATTGVASQALSPLSVYVYVLHWRCCVITVERVLILLRTWPC